MVDLNQFFDSIVAEMSKEHPVTEGTMMGSRGIQYKKKNFVFIWGNDKMVFRLGRDFEPQSEGIHDYELLNPFKNKPPLKDWFVLRKNEDKWYELAIVAYQFTKAELG